MKLKSHKGTQKRVRKTSKGKLVWAKPAKRHLLINKSKRQKSMFPHGRVAPHAEVNKLEKLLPY